MTDRPILFSGAMVRAILAGKKTQTRRVLWRSAPCGVSSAKLNDSGVVRVCPYGMPGDRLWVRERIRLVGDRGDPIVASVYDADGELTCADAWPWKADHLPSIHCPRGLSRITLEVTGVRVERLQAISNEDARAEGVAEWNGDEPGDYRGSFRELWDSINGQRAGCSWGENPWVWVVEFKVADAPPR
jgi:hypothetical protein